ncbi:hypothetical protein OHB41_51315 [Streptomyces sp. NBC_01571]|uniref:hypothetical protein n=1 Tax=Streptomyces sp. NBC_01571 TaxID=2975883 RepID=UPI002254671E|nr:hypothetical protein [Streptomyces sp. NBC_01571]MCX4581349.1 hypothetical protein [Streptomyces sp. NBC_01571]
MNRTATQHAGIAAESVNGLNQRIRAALTDGETSDLARLKDAYEVTASLKLLAQRLTLTATELQQLVGGWHQEGHLLTAPAVDTEAVVDGFSTAMTDAGKVARALFVALDDATKNLAPIGWQESAPAAAPHETQP